MNIELRALLVFLAVAAVDWFWAEYILATAAKQAFRAAVYGASIFLMGAYVTSSYIEAPILILAGAAGGAIGTYACVKYRS